MTDRVTVTTYFIASHNGDSWYTCKLFFLLVLLDSKCSMCIMYRNYRPCSKDVIGTNETFLRVSASKVNVIVVNFSRTPLAVLNRTL